VVVAIPALNEEKYILECVASLLNDPYPRDHLEILIADGGSTDRTRELLTAKYALPQLADDRNPEIPRIKLIENPKRLQSVGFNLATRNAKHADYVVRCDAHAVYPENFVSSAVATMQQHPEVGVAVFSAKTLLMPTLAGWARCVQAAVAFAQMSRLGVGGSTYRLGACRSDYVEHGWHGIFRRQALDETGGYDESFKANEDAELSYRLAQLGWKVWLDSKLAVGYYPRNSVAALARQYWIYGSGRARTYIKHRRRLKLRQLAPILITAGTPPLLAASCISPMFALPILAYGVLVSLFAAHGALKTWDSRVLLSLIVFPTMHYSWGAGFIAGVVGRNR
jgi:succinoglycan biosynthesis protein ExoA